METTRRDFVRTMGLATVCACTGIASLNGCSMIRGKSKVAVISDDAFTWNGMDIVLNLDKVPFLQQPDGAGKFSVNQEIKVLVIQHQPGQYKAFIDQCTHGERELNYKNQEQILECSSFGHSTFRISDGSVIKGPAPTAVKMFNVSLDQHILTIHVA